MHTTQRVRRSGFTLIELLVVIAIIALLASLIFAQISRAQGKARDAQRRSNLEEVSKGLNLYVTDSVSGNQTYPSTFNGANLRWNSENAAGVAATYATSATGTNQTWVASGANWIPGLAPKYIQALPTDPLAKKVNSSSADARCNVASGAFVTIAGYAYASNGASFKVMVLCTPESTITANDKYYETNAGRAAVAWQTSVVDSSASGVTDPATW